MSFTFSSKRAIRNLSGPNNRRRLENAMASASRKVELSDEEVKMFIELLKYSLDYCPIEGVSYEVNITRDKVQDLIVKLEKALNNLKSALQAKIASLSPQALPKTEVPASPEIQNSPLQVPSSSGS